MNKSSSFSNQLSDYADGPAVTAAEVRQQNFLVAAEALRPSGRYVMVGRGEKCARTFVLDDSKLGKLLLEANI